MMLRRFSGLMLVLVMAVTCARADDAPVSGVFKGNGKEAKLAYISATKGETYMKEPTIVLIMTEQDHAKADKPKVGAMFGKFGSALIITVTEKGSIIGCEVVHTAHEKSGFSSIGSVNISDFKLADGKISGKLATKGEQKFFSDTWEIKLQFQTKAP